MKKPIKILGIVEHQNGTYKDVGIAYSLQAINYNGIYTRSYLLPLITFKDIDDKKTFKSEVFDFICEPINFPSNYHKADPSDLEFQGNFIKNLDKELKIKYPQILQESNKIGCLILKNQFIVGYDGTDNRAVVLDFKNNKIEKFNSIDDLFSLCVYIHQLSERITTKPYKSWINVRKSAIDKYRKDPKDLNIKTEITLSPKKS